MAIYLVVTDVDVAARVQKEHLCQITRNAYFVRVEDEPDTASTLADRIGISPDAYGTVARLEELAGWEKEAVTQVINRWIINEAVRSSNAPPGEV